MVLSCKGPSRAVWTFAAAAMPLVALIACSPTAQDLDQNNSVVLADLGPEGNARAIAQYNEFKGKLDADFVRPEPGTQALFFSGFRPFQEGTSNVSGQTVQYLANKMTTGVTTSRSVEGGTLTRGVVMQNNKPYTAYFFEGDTNFATTSLVAASVEAIHPASVINMGQTQAGSRVEIGATNRANTEVAGYDSQGEVSPHFATNTSNVVDENNKSPNSAVYAPDTIRNFASTANLPLSSSATKTGDYLCNATSYASLMAASNYQGAPGGFQPLPGLRLGGSSATGGQNEQPLGTTDQSQNPAVNSAVVGFVHINENEVPSEFGPRILQSAVASIPESTPQPAVGSQAQAPASVPAMQPAVGQFSQGDTGQQYSPGSTGQYPQGGSVSEPVPYAGETPGIGLH